MLANYLANVRAWFLVFSRNGLKTTAVNTGNARPIACRNKTFGPLELPLIKKAIAKLLEIGHIRHIFDGAWLSKPFFAPKPHQENVTDIANCVWRFCVNYVGLNSVTKVISLPIPRCNEAVGNSFGGSLALAS